MVLKLLQQSAFLSEINNLRNDLCIGKSSKLLPLHPFLDKDGIMRVGGRLRNSNIPYSQKHPILLPKSHYVTKLIIESEHINGLHSGIQSTLCNLRLKYWPIDGKNQVRSVVRNCIRYVRLDPPATEYIMGDLPETRVSMTRPFLNTGIDYCGPFFIKEKAYRNRHKIKIYVAIFVCFATKAIHIEAVSDMSTETFLAALRRFISRRGHCQRIFSDNGRNFVGANNELMELSNLFASQKHKNDVNNYLTNKSIKWEFIPPNSPHVAGIWEADVKSFKYHLRRVMGNELYTIEQFDTLIIQIEGILNSRPLTSLSSDPNDPIVLTSAHFLIGEFLVNLLEEDLTTTPSKNLSIWQQIQKVRQSFWQRWHKEYLKELHLRTN